jgi:hypothetical protein
MVKTCSKSLVLLSLTLGACGVDGVPAPLEATPAGTGPEIVWNMANRPLPDIPLPNDVATVADPTSRTGLRINASLVASTTIEADARQAFDEMEGWGTSAPISVRFARTADTSPTDSVIDLEDVQARMGGADYDLSDDPVYLVNLTTGVPVILDMGNGNFPNTIRDLGSYWPNDPHDQPGSCVSQNLLVETCEEGKGLTQADYTPALDLDFDGVLDHPDTLGAPSSPALDGVDNILTWYERETDTLTIRPLLPMTEMTEYAVVLTDRLEGRDGQPVRSPFPAVYHPSQVSGVARLQAILADGSRTGYFGDIAGSGLAHVAFAWTFTTQPVQTDLKVLRDGLYGKGPFASLADEYPPAVTIYRAAGLALDPADEGDLSAVPACQTRMKTPYVVKLNDPDINVAVAQFYSQVIGTDPGQTAWVMNANENLDHVVIGNYATPYFQGDPTDTDPEEARFHLNFETGAGPHWTDQVHFWIAVPKTTPAHHPPFDITFWEHGATGSDSETMYYAGALAAQGIATIGIDLPEHGTIFGPSDVTLAKVALEQPCLIEWITAIGGNRAHDYARDGTAASGFYWWTSHVFHVRDNVRQGLVDMMNATRILKSFDGKRLSTQDLNNDGKLDDLAGDFDGDGTVDVGGPTARYFAAGESLGGMMTEGFGGVEPSVTAATPMSGGAGMADIGLRSYGVTAAVWEQFLGPLVTSTPASDYPASSDGSLHTACSATQRSIRFTLNNGPSSTDVEIACLNPSEVDAGMTVVVTNVASHEVRCARTMANGAFRVAFPANTGDPIDVQIYDEADVVTSYDGCELTSAAASVVGRHIDTFEAAAPSFTPVPTASDTCTGTAGCAQFRDVFYPVGSQLVAPNSGWGYDRNTPNLRRLFALVAAALDPADNFNFAPYYMMRPLYDENGKASPPHGLFSMNTVGDMFVPVSTGSAFARSAGALPFLPPQALAKMPEYADYVTPPDLYAALGGQTPNQVLIANHAITGVARLDYTSAGPTCAADYTTTTSTTCPDAPMAAPTDCADALWDADWTSEGKNLYAAPHANPPLRLARRGDLHVTDLDSLANVWAPRLEGVPESADGSWTPTASPLVGMMNHYLVPQGQHTWDVGDVCRAWDYAQYGDAIMGRFLTSGGTDIYYLSHPTTHATCLVDTTCDVFGQ